MGVLVSTAAKRRLDTLVILGIPLTQEQLARLRPFFTDIVELPAGKEVPEGDLLRADVLFGFLPKTVERRSQVPRLNFVQLASAGADSALGSPLWKDLGKEHADEVALATAAGIHVGPIPQYFIATTLALFHKLQEQIVITQTEKRWPTDQEVGGRMFVQEYRGKTVGVLGYGHIGRESARLARAFGATVIAATSDGKRKPQGGYIVPGTGDMDGSVPSAYYSTASKSSFAEFLEKSDVVLVSVPSTAATRYIINEEALAHMKPSAILVNIGRGDLVSTDALVKALDEGRIAGAALDVTDPEPLPAGHTLFGRWNVIVTPHLSGRTVRYFDLAVDVLVENLKRIQAGKDVLNRVDPQRGY